MFLVDTGKGRDRFRRPLVAIEHGHVEENKGPIRASGRLYLSKLRGNWQRQHVEIQAVKVARLARHSGGDGQSKTRFFKRLCNRAKARVSPVSCQRGGAVFGQPVGHTPARCQGASQQQPREDRMGVDQIGAPVSLLVSPRQWAGVVASQGLVTWEDALGKNRHRSPQEAIGLVDLDRTWPALPEGMRVEGEHADLHGSLAQHAHLLSEKTAIEGLVGARIPRRRP